MNQVPANQSATNRFPEIVATGNAYELGLAHGHQAADLVERYLRLIEKSTNRDRSVLAGGAMAFVALIETLNPLYLDEVKGLAEGARISFEEAMICQVRGAAVQGIDNDGCTAFALTGEATRGGRTLAGQNQDLGAEFADVGVVLRLAPNDGRPRVAMFTFAGQLGYMGMNEYGVAHFANGLGNAPFQRGLTHYPLKRRCFEMRNVGECVEILRQHRTCGAGNMVFCDGEGGIADVEIRPEGIAVFDDTQPCQRLHTNHYVSDQFATHEDGNTPDSVPRLDRIRELVAADWGDVTIDSMKQILADHDGDPGAICRHGARGSFSVAGYIADATSRVLHVRRGFGCTGTWSEYEV